MANSDEETAKRLLTLAVNICLSRSGLSQEQLMRRIPAYQSGNADSQRRKFERDIRALREAGLNLIIEESSDHAYTYSVDGSSFPRETVEFTAGEARMILSSADAWRKLPPATRGRLRNKLAAYTTGPIGNLMPLRTDLDKTKLVEDFLELIDARRPVSFEYRSSAGVSKRDVFPWAVRARGQATYIYGYDLNRDAPRTFRLSRIVSALEPLAEGDFFDLPTDLSDDSFQDFYLVAPLLLIREGAGSLVRLRCSEPISVADYPQGRVPKDGWDLCQGARDDREVWLRTVLESCRDVVPLAPPSFVEAARGLLETASSWQDLGTGSDA